MLKGNPIVLAVAAIALLSTVALAQSPTPPPNTGPTSATTANPQLIKQLAPQRRAQKKQKRTNCERQANQQKLKLGKRIGFMRSCLKG